MKKSSKAGSRILQGAKEALEFARGDADLKKFRVHVPTEVNVRTIRRRLRLTQHEFSRRFGIPQGTLRDWEQGRAEPDQAARAYLEVIASAPDVVRKAVGRKLATK